MKSAEYPRPLRAKELDLLQSVLPVERSGYRHYRELIAAMVVLGEGRRGAGNYVLGYPGDEPDNQSPLAPVVAYGVVETTRDQYSITVREQSARQVDVEIVSRRGEEIPDHFEEKGRWTYSRWQPGMGCPRDGTPVREVTIDADVVLALAPTDRRIWVWERPTGVVRPVPITNLSHALMRVKGVRDPEVALRPSLLFERLGMFTDDELRRSFIAYNAVHPKVGLTSTVIRDQRPRPWTEWIRRLLGRKD